jgi:enoyl-CoA hydratase/carnithine racemase
MTMQSAAPLLAIRDDGPVRIFTLVNSARRNPLSTGLIAEMRAALAATTSEPRIRVLIIAAEGPAFSAGHDLKEITAARASADRGKAFFENLMRACAQLMLDIVHTPIPVIAAVEGIATAAGCQLVATCDLAIAGTAARFATPGVHIGLFCSTPMVALSRNISNKHAMDMLLTGEMIDAETAHRFGLVNRVVAQGEALGAAIAMAKTIATKPPATLRIGKEAFYRQREMRLDEAYAYASAVMVENMLHREAEDGIAAFLERR